MGLACSPIASAISSQVVFSVVLLFIGVFTMTMLASSNSIVQITAGDHIRGRVMSVYLLVYLLSAAVGGPLLGSIDQHLGPRVGLFLTGCAVMRSTGGLENPVAVIEKAR